MTSPDSYWTAERVEWLAWVLWMDARIHGRAGRWAAEQHAYRDTARYAADAMDHAGGLVA